MGPDSQGPCSALTRSTRRRGSLSPTAGWPRGRRSMQLVFLLLSLAFSLVLSVCLLCARSHRLFSSLLFCSAVGGPTDRPTDCLALPRSFVRSFAACVALRPFYDVSREGRREGGRVACLESLAHSFTRKVAMGRTERTNVYERKSKSDRLNAPSIANGERRR